MRFRADTFDAELAALLDELVDQETVRAIDGEGLARETAAAMLGIKGGDTVPIVGGYVVTPEPPEEIDRLVASARDARARGLSLLAAARTGVLESPGSHVEKYE